MSQIIAGIYEIQNEIGAGGGGIVYMGRHLRLEKQVVLKADKRTLSAGVETLRREVDMLKGLSHTYIPQVYDFVQEDGVVYTVMDFIEGESWDKLIGRGQLSTQPEVIKWACQLLEALDYLHSRPPHGILHGDIKPANIMLRPSGDICLIDYNIALALGEDGAVKVGFSRGYASPEHYGADYIKKNRPAAAGSFSDVRGRRGSIISEQEKRGEAQGRTTVLDEDGQYRTEVLDEDGQYRTEVLDEDSQYRTEILKEDSQYRTAVLPEVGKNTVQPTKSKGTAGSSRGILLDVRSDIYSLGATLYHMLSGRRPAEDALEVVPLGEDVCSPAVSAIIQKAMAPEPEMRYQSAEEMRNAFLGLYKRDERVIRHKRRMAVSGAMLTVLFLVGVSCSFVGLRQLEGIQKSLALAEYSANSLAEGDVSSAIEQALRAIPSGKSILEAPVTAQAQKALTDALGVYDLSDGFKSLAMLPLPSAPFDIVFSPEGSYLAVVYAFEAAVFNMENMECIVALPMQNSALSDVVFVDETHIFYAGSHGVAVYDLEAGKDLWTGEIATTLSVSADSTTAAAVNRDDDHVLLYRVSDGQKIGECSLNGLHLSVTANDIFADPADDIFALNADGSLLAVSFYNGGLAILDTRNPEADMLVYEESDYRHFSGGFHGKYFAFTAKKGGETLFGLIDTAEAINLGEYTSSDGFYLKADEKEICLAQGNLLVDLNPESLEEKELAYTGNAKITGFSVGEEYVLAATDDNCFSFYDSGANLASVDTASEPCDFVALAGNYAAIGNRNEPSVRLMELENHKEAQLLSYDARYTHDEARISQDGQTAMLFCYRDFRIYDMTGNCLTQVSLPDAENIYDQQFRKSEDGSWLEVIWYDGTIRHYSASDGSLLSESRGEPPAKDLYEEFYVGQYRIASALHEAPKVYELLSGKLVATLEEDSYLTYVTAFGEYVITEYISAAGERYGILLDRDFEKLAYLPRLCDIAGDKLIFDYESGDLRQCSLYSLPELIALGKEYLTSS